VRGPGLDVHRGFCEVAIAENGRVRSGGRIATRVPVLELFAQSLAPDDVVALEATTGTDRIVGVLQRHGIRVVVANTRKLRSITEAKAKTDRLDAQTLARLLMSGLLDPVWTPDERTRALRRLTNRRERIVRARTRAKNEAHGLLSRNLCERPPVTDAFGKAGREWLAGLELPVDERLTLDGGLRQVDFLDGEIAASDREIAKQALAWPEVLRLMTVPGVNVQTAATFMASIGDIRRFPSARKLVSYLGLDPRVRQSGQQPGQTWPDLQGRRIRGQAHARRSRVEGDADARAAARVLRAHPDAPRPAGRRDGDRPQARRAVLVPAHPRTGLRVRAARDDPLSPPGQRLASGRAAKSGCGRDTGARISRALEGQSRAAGWLAPKPALR
jgi:transposase